VNEDRRLIEDYLPIKAISKEASREKSVRKGHISTLHLWWARRPLVACRAAVYGALVPASQFEPENGPDNKKQSLGRANAAKFIERLCKYPGDRQTIADAQRHILEAHAERLSRETGKIVSAEDIVTGRAPRPQVLDMFAGGGAIPLEALRLGCEAYALDLNPVAHIIELCTLVYPQKYGKPDPSVRGMTGPKYEKSENTWGGLAEEVRYWGNWVLEKVKAEIGDLYTLVPDPDFKGEQANDQMHLWKSAKKDYAPLGFLLPLAYLWTRTVRCKNPSCEATVPLLRQSWLCKRKGGKRSAPQYTALKVIAEEAAKEVRFEVVNARSPVGLGFDPSIASKGGNATCHFCGTVADSDYVKAEGCAKRFGHQLMTVVTTRLGKKGKLYLSPAKLPENIVEWPDLSKRLSRVARKYGITVPEELLEPNPRSCVVQHIGFTRWREIRAPRQLHVMTCVAGQISIAGKPITELVKKENRESRSLN
jgi:putative DNA methylase